MAQKSLLLDKNEAQLHELHFHSSPWALRLNSGAWHTRDVLFLPKYTPFFPQTLKKHEVLGTARAVRDLERSGKSQLQVADGVVGDGSPQMQTPAR